MLLHLKEHVGNVFQMSFKERKKETGVMCTDDSLPVMIWASEF